MRVVAGQLDRARQLQYMNFFCGLDVFGIQLLRGFLGSYELFERSFVFDDDRGTLDLYEFFFLEITK